MIITAEQILADLAASGIPDPHVRPSTAACGTTSGYRRHHRLGQTPCRLCVDANRASRRASYHRNKTSGGAR